MPYFIRKQDDGLMIFFRYGVIVFINITRREESEFLEDLKEHIHNPLSEPITEELEVSVSKKENEGIIDGVLYIKEASQDRLYLIAEVLSKSLKLDIQENIISGRFEEIKPFAMNIANQGKVGQKDVELLKYIGKNLLSEHELANRTKIGEKPALLWENHQLEPLYAQLLDEFEIEERQTILERKLELVSRTAMTSLQVAQHKHSIRLEVYIVLLIALEIVIELYSLFLH